MKQRQHDPLERVATQIVLGGSVALAALDTLALPIADRVRGRPLDGAVGDPGLGRWLVTLLPGVVLTVGIVVAAVLVLRLARSIETGRPFTPANVTLLRFLSVGSFIGVLLHHGAVALADRAVGVAAPRGGLGEPWTDLWVPLVVSSVIGLMAEAFARALQVERGEAAAR